MARRRALVPLATVALVAGLLGSADAAPAPEARGFGGSAEVTVPAGGAGYVTSGDLNATIKAGQVIFFNASASDEGYAQLAFMLAAEPTPARRVLACAFLSRGLDFLGAEDPNYEIRVEEQLVAVAAARTCVRLAQAINAYQAGGRTAARAGNPCTKESVKIRADYEHTDAGWTVTVAGGELRPAGKASDLRIACRMKGDKVVAGLRPKKKGASLRSAVSKQLSVAVVSPTDAAEESQVKVTFKKK